MLKGVLNRNTDVFLKHKAGISCMTPHKSEDCRAVKEMLLEDDMIELSKSPWACGVIEAKKNVGQLKFSCDICYQTS